MTTGKREEFSVTAYCDHEVIVPPNQLRKAWRDAAHGENDPVAQAEQALASLSDNFAAWMEAECARLDAAREAVRLNGLRKSSREALFHAAHDIKGQADTLGFPLAAAAADSLCGLIEGAPETVAIPLVLIDQHVDAVKAIVREHPLPHAEALASQLTTILRAATKDFLARTAAEPDGFGEGVTSPPTAPTASGK